MDHASSDIAEAKLRQYCSGVISVSAVESTSLGTHSITLLEVGMSGWWLMVGGWCNSCEFEQLLIVLN